MTYRHRHFVFSVPAKTITGWKTEREAWTYRGLDIDPPAALRVDGDTVPPLPPGIERHVVADWNRNLMRSALQEIVALPLDRTAGSVVISRSQTGAIAFDGLGLPGRTVDLDAAVELTIVALEQGADTVVLPVREHLPKIVVEDRSLRDQGIRELVAVGESDYTGSTKNRIHNIGVGLKKFNGHFIPQHSTFSFVETLGSVGPKTGYRKELTILGDKTMPDYGGGLCQVSTTAYRGVWEAGFPIVQRKNHSFAVHYYSPQGTDATIYPPHIDMKFVNDGSGALLIQTYNEGTKAYFLYYGTRDNRTAEIIGPYTWDHRAAPTETKTEYTTDLAPGERKKVGEKVPGMKAQWLRIVRRGDGESIDSVFSAYEARPLFYQIGVAGTGAVLPADAVDPAA